MVRCNGSGEIGFLRDERRMNVALTRGRVGVEVVGRRGMFVLQVGAAGSEVGVWGRFVSGLPVVSVVEGGEGIL